MRVKRLAQWLAHGVLPVKAGPLLINSRCWGTGWPRPELRGRGDSPLLALGPQFITSSPPSCARSPGQRTDEELDLIFEELLHIKAVAHLSNSVSPPAQPCPPHPQPPFPVTTAGPKDIPLPFCLWLGSFSLISCPRHPYLKVLLPLFAHFFPLLCLLLNPRSPDLTTSLSPEHLGLWT